MANREHIECSDSNRNYIHALISILTVGGIEILIHGWILLHIFIYILLWIPHCSLK